MNIETQCPDSIAWLTPEEVVADCYTGPADSPTGDALDAELAGLQSRIDAGDLCVLTGSGTCHMTYEPVVLMADAWSYLSEPARSLLTRYESGDLDGI